MRRTTVQTDYVNIIFIINIIYLYIICYYYCYYYIILLYITMDRCIEAELTLDIKVCMRGYIRRMPLGCDNTGVAPLVIQINIRDP